MTTIAKAGNRWLAPVGRAEGMQAMVTAAASRLIAMAGGADRVDIDRLGALALLAAQKNQKLLECTGSAVMLALLDGARLGLEPDGVHGALVPYKAKGGVTCQFLPMYRGLVAVALEEGLATKVDAFIAFAGDPVFDVRLGTEQYIHHVPTFDDEARGGPIAVYAVAKLDGGDTKFAVMTRDEVHRVRDVSHAWQNAERSWNGKPPSQDSPWHTWPSEMWKKTALKRLAKTLGRRGSRLAEAVQADDAAEVGIRAHTTAVPRSALPASTSAEWGEPPEHLDGEGAEGDPSEEPPAIVDYERGQRQLVEGAHDPERGKPPGVVER